MDHNSTYWYRKDRSNQIQNKDYGNDVGVMHNNSHRNNRPCNNNYLQLVCHRPYNYPGTLHRVADCRPIQDYYY